MIDSPRSRLGLNSQTIPAADAVAVVQYAAAAGFATVEFAGELVWDRPIEPIMEILRSTGISVLGLCPTSVLHGWHAVWDAAVETRFAAELDLAAALGAEYFVMPIMRPDGDPGTVAAALRAAAPLAAARGLRLAVESIGHVPLLSDGRELIMVLDRVGAVEVGVLLDVFHFFRAGHTIDDLALFDGLDLLAVQLSNANQRPTGELLGYRDRTFPLDGRFPVAELIKAVRATRPEVDLVVEVIGEVARSHPPAEGVRLARLHLDRVLESGTGIERRSA
jgi:4-hydroxyphenylpyruvate dioxygenase